MMPSTPPRTTRGSFFEGLFSKGLKPTGEFAQALREAGFDPARIEVEYPIAIWNTALALAWKHRYPTLTRDQAHREIGRVFLDGLSQTILGAVLSAGLPLIGPARFIRKVPSYWKADSFEYTIETRELAPRHWQVSYRNDPDQKPYFIAGMLDVALQRTRVTADVQVTSETPEGFDIEIRW